MRIVLLTALLSGCTFISDLDGEKCESDADCSDGRICSPVKFCLIPDEEALECSAEKQCESGKVCVRGACEVEEDARWGCIDDLPEEPMTGTAKSTLRMRVQKRGTKPGDTVPVGSAVTVVACKQASCDQPVGPFKVDSSGSVDVVVEQGFLGFVKFAAAGLRDTLYQLQSPLNVDRSAPQDVVMWSDADVTELATAASASIDSEDGALVVFQVLDCLADPSADVTVAALDEEPKIDVFYLGPDQAVQSNATATSGAGVAVASDVPVGTARFSLTRKGSTDPIDSLEVETLARSVTYLGYQFGE